MDEPLFVAEIKLRDPFTKWRSDKSMWQLMELACEHGDIVAVHTHPAWFGSLNWLKEVRRQTNKPILAKGAHMFGFEVNAALEAGANYVLTMNPEMNSFSCWYEVPEQTFDWGDEPRVVVVNARSLWDGTIRPARDIMEKALAKKHNKMVQASGIRHPSEVIPRVYAYIVGRFLPEFVQEKGQ